MAVPWSRPENSYSTVTSRPISLRPMSGSRPITTRPFISANPLSHGPLRVSGRIVETPANSTQGEFLQSSFGIDEFPGIVLAAGMVGSHIDRIDVAPQRSEAVPGMPYAHQFINSGRVGNGSGRILLTWANAARLEEIARFFPGVPLVVVSSDRVGNGNGTVLHPSPTRTNAAGSEEIDRFFPGVPLVVVSSGRGGNGNGTVIHPSPTRTNAAGSEEMAVRLFNGNGNGTVIHPSLSAMNGNGGTAITGASYRNVTTTVDYSGMGLGLTYPAVFEPDEIQSGISLAGIEYGTGGINLRRTETVDGHSSLRYVSGMATGPTFSNFPPQTQNYGSVRADHEIPINIGSNDQETSVELDNILSGISRSTQGILVQVATGTINRALNHSSYSPFVDAAVLAGIGFTVAGIATRRNNRDLSRVFAKTGAVLAAAAIIASICIPLPPPVAYIVGPLAFILAATAVVLAT